MINHKKAIEAAETISNYCWEQKSCQNCIFRLHAPDKWNCQIQAFDIQEVVSNYAAKKKNYGYI